ncbi:STAS domain-containing protein [Pseudonocardia xishanensis]|uniref:Anti-sigma factor antagonist n=1 Tax=Pseudonocardia xishanensis TaxID=630995 RepID=A0ABP8S203_9PSEU
MTRPERQGPADAEPAADFDADFDALVERHPHATVVRVRGEIDSLTVDRLNAAVRAAPAASPLVLDLTRVRFLGSVGIAALIVARNRAQDAGTETRLVVGGNRTVLRPLEASGLRTEFSLFPDVELALG